MKEARYQKSVLDSSRNNFRLLHLRSGIHIDTDSMRRQKEKTRIYTRKNTGFPMRLKNTPPKVLAALSLAVSVAAPAAQPVYDFRIYAPGITASATAPAAPAAPAASIVANGSSRNWADGTYATSCNAYLNGDGNPQHVYQGATGSGTYRIKLGAPTDVYCDMVADGGGWTLVMTGVAGSVTGWASATGTLNVSTIATQGTTAKLADSDIQALTVNAIRLTSSSTAEKRFVKATCRYGHTTSPYNTPCGTTYSDLQWDGAMTTNDTRGVGFGIGDTSLTTASLYFETNDNRGYGWFVGTNSGVGGQYAGTGYGTPASLQMWAK
jgi:hypothetical protein